MSEPPEVAFEEYTLLTAVETGLRGLIHWWDLHQAVPWDRENAARGLWQLEALMFHADVLFTSSRSGDPQRGAALRTLRDVGQQDLVEQFEAALRQPATEGGRELGQVIKRVRNAFGHLSYNLQQHGDDFLFWGGPNEFGFGAMNGLVATTRIALASIEQRKITLVGYFFLSGLLDDLMAYIASGVERARAQAKRERRKRSRGDSASSG